MCVCVCVLVLGWCTPPPLTSHPVPFRPNSLLPSSRPFSLVDPTDDLVDLLFGLSCGVCVRGLLAYKILVSVVVEVACLSCSCFDFISSQALGLALIRAHESIIP